jgi:UDP-3-O-[3-hydroxymyristoyl] N-acetylglucosamine deacetylase
MNVQRTLRRSISCAGIGLHSGKKVTLSLRPAAAGSGIRFRRADLGGLEVPATVQHVGGINYATGLTRDAVHIDTVEHLLSAIVSLGIDNVLVELNSPEVPIMDGSAAPFVYLIHEAGVKTQSASRKYLKVLRPITMARGDKRIALYPSDHFKVTYSIAYDHPLLRHQSRTIRLSEETFVDEIAPARTFTFLKEVEMLRQQGLALGGSLENAIVVGDTGVLNNALRFDDEFVRHKILDVIGDMALVGHPLIGHLVAHRGGHALHTAFAAQVLEEQDAWTLVEAAAPAEHADLGAVVPVMNRSRPVYFAILRIYASSLSFSYLTVLRNRLSSR